MTRLMLDRMTIEEAVTPLQMAAEIRSQLPTDKDRIPIDEVAKALDITEIREEELDNFEGALVTTAEWSDGKILVNSRSSRARQRFTIAHELGHFLSLNHQPNAGLSFQCTRSDLEVQSSINRDKHRLQEAEANSFAIELLAPRAKVAPYFEGDPSLARPIKVAKLFGISHEAAFRRYVELYPGPIAIVACRNGRIENIDRTQHFPTLRVAEGDHVWPAPKGLIYSVPGLAIVDPARWFLNGAYHELKAHTVEQSGGWSRTLLHLTGDLDRNLRQLNLFPQP